MVKAIMVKVVVPPQVRRSSAHLLFRNPHPPFKQLVPSLLLTCISTAHLSALPRLFVLELRQLEHDGLLRRLVLD